MEDRFLQLLVADYLEKSNMRKTLESFRQESSSPDSLLTSMTFVEIAAKLQLPESGNESKSLLSNLIGSYFKDCAMRMRVSQDNLFEKLLSRPKPSRPFNLNSSKSIHFSQPFAESNQARPRSSSSAEKLSEGSTPIPLRTHEVTSPNFHAKTKHSSKLHKIDKRFLRSSLGLTVSPENWLPMSMRMNSVGRSVIVANETLKTALRHAQTKGLVNNLFDYENFMKAESLGMMKRESCGCCGYAKFPSISLVMKVSLKAVIDIRKKWDPQVGSEEDDSKTRLIVPRCYDQVRICRFCSQFFHDQEEYRPSFESIRQSERRKVLLARQVSKDRLDPLKLCEEDRLREEQEEDSMPEPGSFVSQASLPSLGDSS